MESQCFNCGGDMLDAGPTMLACIDCGMEFRIAMENEELVYYAQPEGDEPNPFNPDPVKL